MISASKAKLLHASTTLVEAYDLNQRYCELCSVRSYVEPRRDLFAVESDFRLISEHIKHVLEWLTTEESESLGPHRFDLLARGLLSAPGEQTRR